MIRVIRLVSGEEIVGKVEIRDNTYFVQWPVQLVNTTDKDSDKARVRVELFASQVKDHSVEINKGHVLYIGEPLLDLAEYYETTFGKMLSGSAAGNEA